MSSFPLPGWAQNENLEEVRKRMVEEASRNATKSFNSVRAVEEATGQKPLGGLVTPNFNTAAIPHRGLSLNATGPQIEPRSPRDTMMVNAAGTLPNRQPSAVPPMPTPAAAPATPPLPPIGTPGSASLTNAAQQVGITPGTDANATANRATAVASDANAQRNEAIRNEAARLSAAGAAQNNDAILADAENANRRMGAVVAGRSPEGVYINPMDPVMTAQQAQGMGLKYSYGSALPPGYELEGSNLRRIAPPPTMIEGEALAKANAELTRDIPRVALPPMPKGPLPRGGQAAGETSDQFDTRLGDVRAARASKSPASLSSGAERKVGDTYADQKNVREGRQFGLDVASARSAPTRTEQSRMTRDAAYAEGVKTRTATMDAKQKTDFYNNELQQINGVKQAIQTGKTTDPDGSLSTSLLEAERMLKTELAAITGAAAPPTLGIGTPPPPPTTGFSGTMPGTMGGGSPATGAEQPLPMPKTAAEAEVGKVYNTAKGPMRWNGQKFVGVQ